MLRGVQRRNRAALETAMFTAYQTMRFMRTEKPRELRHYLAELTPRRPQTNEEIAASLDAWIARGAPIAVKTVEN